MVSPLDHISLSHSIHDTVSRKKRGIFLDEIGKIAHRREDHIGTLLLESLARDRPGGNSDGETSGSLTGSHSEGSILDNDTPIGVDPRLSSPDQIWLGMGFAMGHIQGSDAMVGREHSGVIARQGIQETLLAATGHQNAADAGAPQGGKHPVGIRHKSTRPHLLEILTLNGIETLRLLRIAISAKLSTKQKIDRGYSGHTLIEVKLIARAIHAQ